MYSHLHLPRAQRMIWQWLDTHPDRRPRVGDLARMAGMSEVELRRGLRRDHAAKCREMITFGCLTYAARLIGAGVKVEAAMMRAGFHNKTVFCRNFRDYLGCQPHDFRGQGMEALKDWDDIEPTDGT